MHKFSCFGKNFTCLLFFIALIAQGQTSSIRNKVYVGVRPMSMGETFAAISDDANAIYWNPAGLAFMKRYEAQFMSARLFQTELRNTYAAVALPDIPFLFQSDRLALGFDYFGISLDDGELEHSQNDFSMAISYRPFANLALGIKAKYLYSSTSLENKLEGDYSGWGADLGALYRIFPRLTLGLTAYDLTDTKVHHGNGSKEVLFRRNIRYGIAYELSDWNWFNKPLLALDIDDRLHLGGEIWLLNILALRTGLSKDIYEHGEKEMTFSFGTGIRYKYLQFDYGLTDSPFLQNTSRFSLSLAYDIAPPPITVSQIQTKDIYASQYRFHEKDTCAVVTLAYHGKKPLQCKISLKDNKYGIKAEKTLTLYPDQGDTIKSVDLTPSLPAKLLNLAADQADSLTAMVSIEPRTNKPTQIEKAGKAFTVYGLGAINWPMGPDQAVAFITRNDVNVQKLASAIQPLKDVFKDTIMLSPNVSTAAQLFELLGQYGVRKRKDARSTLSRANKPIDTIQYPVQTLELRSGDCEDLSILYASFLENQGIRTVLIDAGDHIMVMFDTDIHERYHLVMCMPSSHYILYDQRIWLPVESMDLGSPFWTACQTAAEEIKAYQTTGTLNFIDVQRVERKFEPAPIKMRNLKCEFQQIQSLIEQHTRDMKRWRLDREDYLRKTYYGPLQNNPMDYDRWNELATIKSLLGDSRGAFDIYDLMQKRGAIPKK